MKKVVLIGGIIVVACIVAVWSKVQSSSELRQTSEGAVERSTVEGRNVELSTEVAAPDVGHVDALPPSRSEDAVERDGGTSADVAGLPAAEPRFASYPLNAEAVELSTVPAHLRVLFDGEATGYSERCRHVKALGNTLSADEVAALLLFLNTTPEALGMPRSYFNSVGDKVITKLEHQVSIPPELVDVLMGMFYDQAIDFTWREYCVQHLGSLYPTHAAEGRREEILGLFAVASLPDIRMGGTAVLALSRNVGAEGVSPSLVAELAAGIALDGSQGDASRITAMLSAAELGEREMLALARSVVESTSNSVHFRMSSMATIGMLGDASDLGTLEEYTGWYDMRLRLASQAAVEKINKRSGK